MSALFRGSGGGLLRMPPDNTALMRGDECCCSEPGDPCTCCEPGTTQSKYKVTISGVTDGPNCDACASHFNRDWTVVQFGCPYSAWFNEDNPCIYGEEDVMDCGSPYDEDRTWVCLVIRAVEGGVSIVVQAEIDGWQFARCSKIVETESGTIDCLTDVIGSLPLTDSAGYFPCDFTSMTCSVASI